MKVPLRPPPWQLLNWDSLVNAMLRPDLAPGPYLHWDDVFHRTPPAGYTRERWWARLKLSRLNGRYVELRPIDGPAFSYNVPDEAQEMLLRIDHGLGAVVLTSEPASRETFVVRSLIEESITSSQLEGASTSRRVAKEMLRTGRKPKDRSEQMIANNYAALEYVRDHSGEPLTPAMVLDLQRVVTEGTLDDPADAGRLQEPGEVRVRVWGDHDQILHTPPPAEELPERLDAMCAFANSEVPFVHPVVRAVILHFWLAYDHPFADGNGRTARALFYWSMLRQDYHLVEFIAISSILRKAPPQYARSFLLTETDDNDLTYFVLHQLRVIVRAMDEMTVYARRKAAELRATERLARSGGRLNHRQLALVGHALRNPDAWYSVESHRRSHGVVYETARSDLLDLVELGLLDQGKVGKAFRFTPAAGLADRLGST